MVSYQSISLTVILSLIHGSIELEFMNPFLLCQYWDTFFLLWKLHGSSRDLFDIQKMFGLWSNLSPLGPYTNRMSFFIYIYDVCTYVDRLSDNYRMTPHLCIAIWHPDDQIYMCVFVLCFSVVLSSVNLHEPSLWCLFVNQWSCEANNSWLRHWVFSVTC